MARTNIKLSADKRKVADQLGKQLFHYITTSENHASALRNDPEGFSAAYREYASLSPDPLGTLPDPADLDRCIKESEVMLDREHLFGLNAGLFLSHPLSRKMSEDHEEKIVLAAIGRKTELLDEYMKSYVVGNQLQPTVPQDIMELMALDPNRMSVSGHFGGERSAPPQVTGNSFPVSTPVSHKLDWSEIQGFRSFPVSSSMIAKFKMAPQSTMKHIFIAFEDGELSEAFKVVSVTFHEDTIIFYLLYVEHNEGIGFPSEDFYDMISKMNWIQVV